MPLSGEDRSGPEVGKTSASISLYLTRLVSLRAWLGIAIWGFPNFEQFSIACGVRLSTFAGHHAIGSLGVPLLFRQFRRTTSRSAAGIRRVSRIDLAVQRLPPDLGVRRARPPH